MTYTEFVDQSYINMLNDEIIDLVSDKTTDALQKLIDIRDQLGFCKSSQEELLDYYSQDSIFASIVGTANRYTNLCNYIDKANKQLEESDEALTTIAALCAVSGLVIGTVGQLIQDKTLFGAEGLANHNATHDLNLNFNEVGSICAMPEKNAVELCNSISTCLSHLRNWSKYPHNFNEEELKQVAKSVNINLPTVATSEKIAAGTKAALKSVLPSILTGTLYGLSYGLIYGFFLGPQMGAVAGSAGGGAMTTASFVVYASAKYKQELNKNAKSTLAQLGWNNDNFKKFSHQVAVVIQETKATYKDIKHNKRNFKSKEDFKQCKAFYTIAMIAVKGLAKAYISMCHSSKPRKQK